jgi:glucose/arabinose dehydrogenase
MSGRGAIAPAILVAIALVACSDDDDAATPTATDVAATDASDDAPATSGGATTTATQSTAVGQPTTAPQPSGTTTPTGSGVVATTSAPTTPPGPPATFGNPVVAIERVAQVELPVALAARPGDAGLYVVDQDGKVIRIVVDPGAEPQTVEVADVTDRTSADGERGLLGLAFSADGALAWLDYTDNNGDTVVAEYPVAADGTFDVGAERVLLTIDQPYPNHNGGDLALGPDGMLYVAMGDGGSGGDPERRASDPTNLLGKLLRIDPTPSGDAAYTIPADNPFATGSMGGIAGAPEVWSWGLRNPWRIAFDPVTHELWIADVGQNAIEEVDAVSATEHPAGWGANFGWSAFEGNDRFNEDVPDPGNLVFPVWTFTHAEGCSISGGAVYRGTAIPELAPAYVYSDYCAGRVWAFDLASGRNVELVNGLDQVSAVRAGPDGELYVLERSGGVNRLVP